MHCRLFIVICVLASSLMGHSQKWVTQKMLVTQNGTPESRNALIYLPLNFSKTTTYPLVVYLHGLSQAGTDINRLYQTGLPKVLKDGYQPSLDFIMIAVQSPSYSIAPNELPNILQYVQKRWAIDTNRIYLTGIDAGGWAAYGSQLNVSATFAKKIAAIVTISATTQNLTTSNLAWWAQSHTPLWTIAGQRDTGYIKQSSALVEAINKKEPGLATLTIRPGIAHGGWNDIYSGKVTNEGKTLWDWLGQISRTKTFSKPHASVSTAPVAAASITTATTATTLKTVRVNIYGGTNAYSNTAWNNWNVGTDHLYNRNSGTLKYSDGTASAITALLSYTQRIGDNTSTYGSGMAPAGVLRYTSYATTSRSLTISGLSTGKTYNIELYASRNTHESERTTFTINGLTRTITTYNNLTNKAAFTNLNPNSQGQIKVTLASTSTYNYINGFTLTENSGTISETTTSQATAGTVIYAGTHIEAERFTNRQGLLLQTTRDFAGGVQNTFDANYGDWISYTVNAPAAGQYTLCFRLACDATGSKFYVRNGSGTVLTTVNVPNTNGWQTWRDATAVVTLAAGTQTLKFQSASSTGWNLNYFEIVKTPLNAFAAYTLRQNSGTSIYLPLGLNLAHLKPGDTLNISGGTYNVIELGNFRGTASYPIHIRNKQGQVTCKIIRLSNTPEYFKLLGNGDPNVKYGFKINGNYTTGSCLTAFGKGFEIGYIEGYQSKSGFFIKKNPSADDPQSQFPNYEMTNISIHHNYIHDITGEGMYLGHTGPDGGQGGNPLLPVRMRNVVIAYNRVDRTGWDGIQLSNATTGNKIHHNTITNFGTANRYGQQAGILLGGNTQGDIYDNVIKYGTGNGIQNFGFGLNKIYNNYLEKVGRNGTDRGYEGAFCNDIIITSETRPKQQIQAYNNTIKYPMPWGAIRVSGYNNNSLPASMQYNKVLLPNAPSNWQKLYFPTYVPYSTVSGNTLIYQ
jgi:poly(3-hydroxybutyrate) depolymerase